MINATKKEKVEGGEKGAGGRTRKVTFPLKLVVMSATLDAHSFGRFFDAKVDSFDLPFVSLTFSQSFLFRCFTLRGGSFL